MRRLLLLCVNYLCLLPFLMALATVFIIDNELANGVISGKYFWFYVSMIGIAVGVTLSFLATQKPVYLNKTDLLVFLFGVVGILSSYLQNSSINTRFILFVLCFILYFYFRIVLSQHKSNRYILLLFILITGFIEAIWGLRQLYGFTSSQHNLFKLTGSFFNPGPYAGYLAMIVPIAFYYLLKNYKLFKHKFNRKFLPLYLRWGVSAITLFTIIIVLPAAMGRASWLAAGGGCVFVGIIWFLEFRKLSNFIKQNKRKAALVFFTTTLVLALGGTGIYHLKKNSADGRALMWKMEMRATIEHPLGVGLGNFSGAYGDAQADYFASGQGAEQEVFVAGAPEYAFNEYLQICIELGMIPFILYITAIISALHIGVKQKRVGESGALVALSIFAFMSYPYSILPFVVVLSFLLASCVVSTGKLKVGKMTTIAILSICTMVVILCSWNRFPTYKAYSDWREIRMLYNMKLYRESVSDYVKLAPYLNDQTAFMFEYSQSLSKSGEYEMSNRIIQQAIKISSDPMFYNVMGKNYQALQQYDLAEVCFRRSANMLPNRVYPYYLLANMYLESGDTLKAKETAKIVLTKEPKTQSTAIKEMRTEMEKVVEL